MWSTLDTSDWSGQISAVVVNTADVDRYIQNNEILGLFDPVKEESLSVDSDEEKIDAIFNSFKENPATKNPDDFVPTPMSSEEKDFLLSQLRVSASSEWKARYIDPVSYTHLTLPTIYSV